MNSVTKDMIISQVVESYPALMRVLEEYGMGCSYCMGSMGETIEGGARMHGINLQKLLSDLNQVLTVEGAAE